ncbi:nSTAND1 domain-containing NTPase [Ramlibacter alkalitolerans]|uniref:ATP-binding protein n=1 Tax=Ramlibacter alkalitolerans TaxID=2039631 RepID=A0ABS1JS09_9BURK|nr:ATP-binding protein [Ramlibacter alkalitolerans]MBL0426951.1 ATP-binding protein [Ramlibacter alkalitolerans]
MSAVLIEQGTVSAQEYDALFTLTLPPRPYPGLRAFEQDEWTIFFGRERMTDEVVSRLVADRLLVIHGDSGCGKSSLLRAGVLPRLEQGNARGGARWRTCTFMPGNDPLLNLATALAGLDGDDPGGERLLHLRRILNAGTRAAEALAPLLCPRENDHVCILVDQFEEVFAHARRCGPEEAQLLIDLLTGLRERRPPGMYAALTMRSEFLGQCARFRGFAEVVNEAQYLLPRMNHEDIVRAICEPAPLFEGHVPREAAEWMIADAGDNQEQLPLIQHGLMLMHREAVLAAGPGAPWRIDLQRCLDRGRLSLQLSGHADAVTADVLRGVAPGEERVVEDLMRALSETNAEGHAIRHPCTFAQLVAATGCSEQAVRRAVDLFRADGTNLLRPYAPQAIGPQTLIDISHEALLRCWHSLADLEHGWLLKEFRNGLVWRSLLVQADSFQRDPENVLSPATLAERSKWMQRRNRGWAQRYGGRWDDVQALLAASEKARRTETRRRRLVWIAAVPTLFLAVSVYQQVKVRASQQALTEALRESETNVRDTRRQLEEIKLAAARPTPDYNVVEKQVDAALRVVQQQALRLEQRQVPQAQMAVAPNVPPRVYFHISDESLRPGVAALERELEQRKLDDAAVVVPGIQLVASGPWKNALRCFHAEECRTEAPRLAALLNALMVRPRLEVEDLSAKYENAPNVRPRHYELWINTEVVLAGRGKAKD